VLCASGAPLSAALAAYDFMRYLAYAMMLAGFFWVCFDQFKIGPIQREVAMEVYGKLPKQQTFTSEEVQQAVSGTIQTYGRLIPSFYIGAFLMLGGGMILDFARTRK
jgi:hypothetical protein